MPEPEYEALVRRRRIWGVPPDAVEQIVADCERTRADLRTRMRELEVRLAQVTTQRDEATQSIAALRVQVERLEQENAETAGRPEMVREEALRFVVDAWAEAQTIREQTRQENEKAEAAAREEIAAARQALAEERERHEAEIATLRERRSKAIADLESLAEHLLNQATHIAALKSPGVDTAIAEPAGSPAAEAPPPAKTATPPLSSSAPIAAEPVSTPAPTPAATAPPRANGGDAEDHLLAKALDDLEAILSASRKTNGTG